MSQKRRFEMNKVDREKLEQMMTQVLSDPAKLKMFNNMTAEAAAGTVLTPGKVQGPQDVPAKPKAIYGKAPCSGSPRQVHNDRLLALDQLIKPQMISKRLTKFSEFANIYSVGVDRNKVKTRNLQAMTKEPWTWISLDKNARFGNYAPDEIRALIKLAGYGFSCGNKSWCCNSLGKPMGKRGRCLGVGRQFQDED